jgi:predicted phosphodiesterase
MRYAIISDIHANEQALKAVLADAAAKGVDRIVCLGDIVGYGPLPAETVRLARAACHIAIVGNHDDAVSGRSSADGFIGLAGDAVSRHRDALAPGDIAWLKNLPYVYEGDGFTACHGDFTDPPQFYYIEEISDAEANFKACGADLMFVGHTHVPSLFLTGASGKTYKTGPQDFTLESGKRYIVNPGSVGYPRERDGKCFSSYVIYDSAEKTVVFRYLPFSVSTVLQRGGRANRRRFALWLGLGALALSALTALLVPVLRPAPMAVAMATEDAGLLVDVKEIDVEGAVGVSANLKLRRDSCPLQLGILFKTADGGLLGEERLTVKRSSVKRRFAVPDGAKRAVFSIRKNSADDKPSVDSFEPAAFRQPGTNGY